MSIIVKKFGGMSLSSTDKIRSIAKRLIEDKKQAQLVIVVSAMGKSTNELLESAKEITPNPSGRDLDFLLSTGECVSAALLSMAIQQEGEAAICLTGQQAGIITDNRHVDASIISIEARNIQKELNQGKIVIITGFQGGTVEGDITTLGRGGSDLSTVAIASALKASRCEILKEAPAIFTADPNVVSEARPLMQLSHLELSDMTFWGGKVIQHRAVELSTTHDVPLYVGPAHGEEEGTSIEKGRTSEIPKVLAVNGFQSVAKMFFPCANIPEALEVLHQQIESLCVGTPQVLYSRQEIDGSLFYLTGSSETLGPLFHHTKAEEISAVTVTCRGGSRPSLIQRMTSEMSTQALSIESLQVGASGTTFYIPKNNFLKTMKCLHRLIE